MKSLRDSGSGLAGVLPVSGEPRRLKGCDVYALVFGLFLGLCLIKFGNPVILNEKISSPTTLGEAWSFAWPPQWASWCLLPLALLGAGLAIAAKPRWLDTYWLWILPLVWFSWQLVSARHTVDGPLTTLTLWQLAGCLACYFLGALALGTPRALHWLLIGVLAAFTFCLVRAANQRLVEFPQDRQLLLEGERTGWTNFTSELVLQMKREGVIITTNGVDVAHPAILAKYGKGRVMGTLVYPNALAGLIVMLFPLSLALAFNGTRHLRAGTRAVVITLTLFLGCAGLFWTGSKLGWLMALALVGVWLFHFNWPKLWKVAALASVMVLGLGLFAIRFHNYFSAGATSVGARFDYWRAAAQNTREHPLVGSGPGTFQRPYAQLKTPEAEMTRLAHNDYLEQFSDSGIVGGISYAAWIALALTVVGRRAWRSGSALQFPVFLGLLGWFGQGLGEFSLYVPALAWIAFTLLGWSVAATGRSSG